MSKWFTAILFLFVSLNVSALRIEYGSHITIQQPVHDNLYIAGGTVILNAPVYGDLIIAGGTVFINDTISNDILVTGGNIVYNGFTAGDFRSAGGDIRIYKNIKGDLVIAGGRLLIENTASVHNVLLSGGSIIINGNIDGELKAYFGEMVVNGNIANDLHCRGGKITVNGHIQGKSKIAANEIVIGGNAMFTDEVHYWSKKGPPDFGKSLILSKAIYDPSLGFDRYKWYYLGAAGIFGLFIYLGMALLFIFMMQYLFANTFYKAADSVFINPAKSLLYGLLYFIAVPILVVLTFVLLISIPMALLMFFLFGWFLFFATEICALVVANWYNNRYEKNWKSAQIAICAFVFYVLFKLVTVTPYIGWVLMTLMVCMAIGGIIQNLHVKQQKYGQRMAGKI